MTANLADKLRRAAAEMFADEDPRWHAVADWLTREANSYGRPERRLATTFEGGEMFPLDPDALDVARAYLGELS